MSLILETAVQTSSSVMNGTKISAPQLSQQVTSPLSTFVFGSLITMIALTAIPFGSTSIWTEKIFTLAVFCLSAISLIDIWLSKTNELIAYNLVLPLMGLVILAVCQGLISVAKEPTGTTSDLTFRFAVRLMTITLSFSMLLAYTTGSRIRILAIVLVLIALASAAFGLAKYGLMTAAFRSNFGGFGQFQNRNHFSLLMEMGLGLVLGLAFGGPRTSASLAGWLLAGAMMWTALLLTHSRGGVVSLLAEAIFFFVVWKKSNSHARPDRASVAQTPNRLISIGKKLAIVGVLVAIVGTSAFLIGGVETINHFAETKDEVVSFRDGVPKMDRPQIWKATWNLIKQHPFFGTGLGAYAVSIRSYVPSGIWAPKQAHNEYLEVLAGGGLFGGALCAWFLAAFIRTARKPAAEEVQAGALKYGALAGLIAVSVHSLFDFGLHIILNALVCVALIAIVVNSHPRRQVNTVFV